MNPEIFDDISIETTLKNQFGLHVDIKHTIARTIPTSHTTYASVFLTTKNQLYVLIAGRSALTLGDVRKIVARMGLVADDYLVPAHDIGYFVRIATDKFKETFPGRTPVDEAELRYYKQLVPYNPALVRIAEIPDGTIRQFDAADTSRWRPAAKFAYRRIGTS